MKKCTHCKIEKPFTDFYAVANGVNGVRPRCKECMVLIERKKYATDEEFRQRKLNMQAVKMREDEGFRLRHRIACREGHLRRAYGLTQETFDGMLQEQGGGCAICGTKQKYGNQGTRMVVDHCHATNKIRGILCDLCNTAIGKFHDDVVLLGNAISYLTKGKNG
jgi:hypothetical protein